MKLKKFLFINSGLFLVAAGIHFFKNPNKFALGGVSGLSLIMTHFFPELSVGSLMLVLNFLLLLICFFSLGKSFASKTAYSSIALSIFVWLLEIFFPLGEPLTQQKLLELLYGVFLPGIGGAIVFNYGSSTGGTDIIAKILSKYFDIRVSISLLVTDLIIAVAAGFFFGVQAFLFSILGVCLKSFVLDLLLESLQVFKIVVIISDKNEEIKSYICDTLNGGATIHTARGAFKVREKEVITTVLSRRHAKMLQTYIKQVDPTAFITISNSSKIIGGFRGDA